MKKIKIPKSGRVNQIVHISDTHIRTGDREKSRYDEYLGVFNGLFDSIKNLSSIKNDACVIVITGDVFDAKNKIEAPGIDLFYMLVCNLAKLAPTYLIAGQHDYMQNKPDSSDIISSLLSKPIDNVEYLNETGCYEVGNVGFGLVTIKDASKFKATTGKNENLLPFPNKFSANVKTKIALFHGIVKSATLQNYRQDSTGYPLEWFSGFHLCLFGDVHQQQIHNVDKINGEYLWDKRMVWSYASSLAQQNFGESLFDHGYLIWDLCNKKTIPVHIKNEYGFVNMRYENGWTYLDQKSWLSVNKLLNNSQMPSNLRIRVHNFTPNIIELHKLLRNCKKIKNYDITTHIGNVTNGESKENFDEKKEINIDFNSIEFIIKHINSHDNEKIKNINWQTWIKTPETMLIDNNSVPIFCHDEVKKQNMKMKAMVDKLNNERANCATRFKKSFKLCYVKWQWILCYGENNWFNFDEVTGKTCVINGKNDSGKSSFLEILCICLFGKSMPSRQNKKYSGSIICNKKPLGSRAVIEMIFSVDTIQYKLCRSFKEKYNKLEVATSELTKFNNNETIGSGKGAVDKWIDENIGNLESFLSQCMVTQNMNQDLDFFSLDEKKQMHILEQMLNLTSIASLQGAMRSARLSYETLADKINTYCEGSMQKINNTKIINIDEAKKDLIESEKKCTKLQKTKDQYGKFSRVTKEKDLLIPDEDILNNINALQQKYSNSKYKQLNIDGLMQLKGAFTMKFNEYKQYHEEEKNTNTNINLKSLEDYLEKIKLKSIPKLTINPEDHEKYNILQTKWKLRPQPISQLNETEIQNEHIRITKEHIDTLNSKPNQPPTKKHNEIEFDFNEVERKIFNKYGSIDALKQFCDNNILSAPQYDIQKINSMQDALSIGKSKIIKEWFEIDNEKFVKMRENYEADKIITEKKITKLKIEINEANELLQTTKYKMDNLILHKVPQPEIDKLEVNKQYAKYCELLENKEKYETEIKNCDAFLSTIASLDQQLVESNNKIENLKSDLNCDDAKISYNIDCWACNAHPWKLQLDNKRNQLNAEISKMEKIQSERNKFIINPEKYEVTKKNAICVLGELNTLAHSTNHKIQWETYDKFTHEHDELIKIINIAQNKMNQQKETLNQYSLQYEKINCICENAKYYMENNYMWTQIERIIEDQLFLHKKYEQTKEAHCYWEQWKIIINEKKRQEEELQYNNWLDRKIKLELKLAEIEIQREYVNDTKWITEYDAKTKMLDEWNLWQTEMGKLNAKINWTKLKWVENDIGITEEIQYWKEILELKPHYMRHIALANELEIENKKQQQLRVDIECYNRDKKSYEDTITHCKNYEKIKNTLVVMSEAMLHICNLLMNYKSWLLEKEILPTLSNKTNALVHTITGNNEYILKHKPEDNGLFYWFIDKIQSGQNISDSPSIVIEKSGGFRKFIFSLAFRIILSKIKTSTISCKQMFIDEGFVAADSENLEKIPEFIKGLVGVDFIKPEYGGNFTIPYDSILLVSHLDIIKDCGDIQVNISKNENGLSQLQHDTRKSIESNIDIYTENIAYCVAMQKNGKRCTAKAKNGNYCGRHT